MNIAYLMLLGVGVAALWIFFFIPAFKRLKKKKKKLDEIEKMLEALKEEKDSRKVEETLRKAGLIR